mmetsp:Transcript_26011/g.41790  ORF Transcript_26011/g.41790 Transcript_26011/m.41790 type:complete len:257 (+) Transcript_26011:135-905(+)
MTTPARGLARTTTTTPARDQARARARNRALIRIPTLTRTRSLTPTRTRASTAARSTTVTTSGSACTTRRCRRPRRRAWLGSMRPRYTAAGTVCGAPSSVFWDTWTRGRRRSWTTSAAPTCRTGRLAASPSRSEPRSFQTQPSTIARSSSPRGSWISTSLVYWSSTPLATSPSPTCAPAARRYATSPSSWWTSCTGWNPRRWSRSICCAFARRRSSLHSTKSIVCSTGKVTTTFLHARLWTCRRRTRSQSSRTVPRR